MEVYHASSVIVEHPDTAHSRAYLDFGPGFYITTLYNQICIRIQRVLDECLTFKSYLRL